MAIFVKPPSPEILFNRLKERKTETPESLKRRIGKAAEELGFEEKFDIVLVNDDLEKAFKKAENIVTNFIAD